MFNATTKHLLRATTFNLNHVEVNRLAVRTNSTIVEIVDCITNISQKPKAAAIMSKLTISTLASVEDLLVSQGHGLIVAKRPTSGIDSTSLSRRPIELDLTVGNNGSNAALSVVENSVAKGHRKLSGPIADLAQRAHKREAQLDRTMGQGETVGVGLRAASRSRLRRCDDVVDALRRGQDEGGEGKEGSESEVEELHLDDR